MPEYKFIKRNATLSGVPFPYDGRKYDLRLAIGEVEDLQDLLDSGPGVVLARLQSGFWKLEDIVQTVRVGLIGAGMDPNKAMDVVERNIIPGQFYSYKQVAYDLLVLAMEGDPEDSVGEPEAVTEPPKKKTSRTAKKVSSNTTSAAE